MIFGQYVCGGFGYVQTRIDNILSQPTLNSAGVIEFYGSLKVKEIIGMRRASPGSFSEVIERRGDGCSEFPREFRLAHN